MPNAASSSLVLEPYSEEAVIRASKACLQELGTNPSLAVVFASADYRPFLADFLELIQLHAHAKLIVGGSASGLVGTGQEAEASTGFSLMLLSLPETTLTEFTFTEEQADNFEADDWRHAVGAGANSEFWLVLANPLKVAAEPWLNSWSSAFQNVPTLGGLASGGARGEDIFLFRNHELIEAGIAIGFKGGVKLHTIVSQGCRPIGDPHAITGADENVLHSIGSLPAYERLNESFESLTAEDKARAAGNLFAGLALNEYVDDFKTGDFLIRNLLGADPQTGDVALAAYPRIGQTLQFQIRDRHSAHEELHRMLHSRPHKKLHPIASFLFVCGGRGEGLFAAPNHDAEAIQERFGALPSIGLFCNGEIGPVRDRNYVHGYTAVIGLLE